VRSLRLFRLPQCLRPARSYPQGTHPTRCWISICRRALPFPR